MAENDFNAVSGQVGVRFSDGGVHFSDGFRAGRVGNGVDSGVEDPHLAKTDRFSRPAPAAIAPSEPFSFPSLFSFTRGCSISLAGFPIALAIGLLASKFLIRRNPIAVAILSAIPLFRCGGEPLTPHEPMRVPERNPVPEGDPPLPKPGPLPKPKDLPEDKDPPKISDKKPKEEIPECVPDVCEGVLQIDQIEETETGFRAPCLSFEEEVIAEGEGNRGATSLDFNLDGLEDFVVFREGLAPAVFQGTGDGFESSAIPGVDLSSDTQDLVLQETEGESPRLLVVKQNESEVYENTGPLFVRRTTLGPGKKGVFVGADVYFCNDGPNYFYQNEGANVYRERGYELWLDDPGECTDLVSFDLNEDGCQDIYVVNNTNSGDRYSNPNRLFLQESDSEGNCLTQFESVEEEMGVAGSENSQDAEWVEFDVARGSFGLSVGVLGANFLYVLNEEGGFSDEAEDLGIRDTGNSLVTKWGPAGVGLDDPNPWHFSGRWGEMDLLYRPMRDGEGFVETYEIHPFPLSDPGSVTNTVGAIWVHANGADEDGIERIDLVRVTDNQVQVHENKTRWVTVCPEEGEGS